MRDVHSCRYANRPLCGKRIVYRFAKHRIHQRQPVINRTRPDSGRKRAYHCSDSHAVRQSPAPAARRAAKISAWWFADTSQSPHPTKGGVVIKGIRTSITSGACFRGGLKFSHDGSYVDGASPITSITDYTMRYFIPHNQRHYRPNRCKRTRFNIQAIGSNNNTPPLSTEKGSGVERHGNNDIFSRTT